MKDIPHNMPSLGREEMEAVLNCMENLDLTTGTIVEQFEEEFSRYTNLNSAAVSSGTAALHLALVSLNIKRNAEIILPSYTCPSVAMPILYVYGKPIFVDIEKDYNISLKDIESRLTEKTKVVVVPHMFGLPADIGPIRDFCEEKDIFLIEDCAQSLGARYDRKKVGIYGDISIFSFYSAKMITSIKGGMTCSRDRELIENIKELRYIDRPWDLEDKRIRFNYIMSDIEASVGREQLKKLNGFIKRRRWIASIYHENLKNVILPIEGEGKKHVYSRFVIRSSKSPEDVIREMEKEDITCRRMYVPPLHERRIFKSKHQKLNNTQMIINSSVSLPIFPGMSEQDVLFVSEKLNEIMR